MAKAEVPVIVAELEFLNVTTPPTGGTQFPLTTVYNVPATGVFRISFAGNTTGGGTLILKWTDELGAQSAQFAPLGNYPNNIQDLRFRALTGTAVTIESNGSVGVATTTNLDVILEQF